MIARKRRISTNAQEVSVQVSYGLPDVKAMLQMCFLKFEEAGGQVFATTIPHQEQDLIYYLRHAHFEKYPDTIADQLSKWAFVQGVKAGYILQSELNKGVYFLSDILGRRPGRPRKKAE